ncbi:MAG: Prolyl oligopeptidase N-terminal beta-propeller domain [Polyangiaceae bacterium]|jgi:Tol biopolymer transport system component|nr:Prolyl oligopeptidase N-terminal beta-propeller domain [Polyangiaceae bacterium]
MNYSYRLISMLLSACALGVACGEEGRGREGTAGGASGSAGRAGASDNAASGGGADDGGAKNGGRGGAAGEGGPGGGVPTGGSDAPGGGGEGGVTVAPEHWLAFQLWTEDDDTHPLFLAGVPQPAEPRPLAADVDFWRWTPDGTRLIYATPAAYGGPPNAAFSVALSRAGSLDDPEPLHRPLDDGDYAWSVSISPDSKTLALQLYEAGTSTWYLRPIDGGVGDWVDVAQGSAVEPLAGVEARLTWSPDGTRVAVVQREDATHDSLFIVDAATRKGSQGSFRNLRVFQWSVDGSRLFADALDPDAGQRVLYAIEADAASDAVELSDRAVHSSFDPAKFAASSDGGTVAFMAQVNGAGAGRLFIQQVGSGQPAVQTEGDNPSNIVWSESSGQFLYIAGHLYAVPRQGGDAVRLNPVGRVAHCNVVPCLRAAGDAFLFMTSDADYTSNQLYDIDLSSASPSARLLSALPAGNFIDLLALAPDPSRLILLTTDNAGKQGTYLVDRSTASPSVTRLSRSPPSSSFLRSPMWSPDSRLLHLVAAKGGGGAVDLYMATIESGTAVLSAPVTPQDRHITGVAAEWRPRPLP